ncbi:excalibur calcium-binding domain-containing protein [Galactobacter valiniphilus]|uniref:excalibur calcium-binding domain-containing protein n=1 Tax=Galactobacter valiniphilus TaxID=2676122 RepID=UPI002D766F17|nr:excalibur calcium-binding domain-containing protein [Galactobacter valiniphilus]
MRLRRKPRPRRPRKRRPSTSRRLSSRRRAASWGGGGSSGSGSSGGSDTYYANCSAVRAAGAAPISVGEPGYSRKLDRDGDGIACE